MAKRAVNQFITLEAARKTVEKWDNEVRKMASKKQKASKTASKGGEGKR